MIRAALAIAVVAGLVVVTSASARVTGYAKYYVDSVFIANGLEEQGISYRGQKLAVDNASCLGLRRFGVKTSDYDLDKFWRFRCTVNAANSHAYDVQLSVTHGPKPTWVYWHYLSSRLIY